MLERSGPCAVKRDDSDARDDEEIDNRTATCLVLRLDHQVVRINEILCDVANRHNVLCVFTRREAERNHCSADRFLRDLKGKKPNTVQTARERRGNTRAVRRDPREDTVHLHRRTAANELKLRRRLERLPDQYEL